MMSSSMSAQPTERTARAAKINTARQHLIKRINSAQEQTKLVRARPRHARLRAESGVRTAGAVQSQMASDNRHSSPFRQQHRLLQHSICRPFASVCGRS